MSNIGLSADLRSPASAAIRAPAFLLAIVLLSLCPVLLVDIPAMVDYPNHLARMSILARAGTPAENPYYEVGWRFYPNLAMDLIVPPIARLIGVEMATRLFYVAGQLLVVGGAMALAYVAQRRFVAAGIAACFLLYSVPFAWGFVNFEFALGLALWGIAAWLATGPSRPWLRFAVHCGFVTALFVAHLFALGIYGIALGLIELSAARERRMTIAGLGITAVQLAAPLVVLTVAMLTTGGSVGGSTSDIATVWWFGGKFGWIFSLNGFSRPLSTFLTAPLLFIAYAAARNGWLRLVGAGPWLLAGFGLVYLAMPFRLFDTAFVDVRVLVAMALVVPAFTAIDIPAGLFRMAAVAFASTIFVANLAYATWVQLDTRSDYASLVAAMSRLERNPRILVGQSGEEANPPKDLADYPMFHIATVAVHYADAFVPTLFATPGKQPLLPRPAYRHLALRDGGPVPVALLEDAAAGRPAPRFIADWTHDFDYVCMVGDEGTAPLPELLEPILRGKRFTLYRVRTSPGPAGRAALTAR